MAAPPPAFGRFADGTETVYDPDYYNKAKAMTDPRQRQAYLQAQAQAKNAAAAAKRVDRSTRVNAGDTAAQAAAKRIAAGEIPPPPPPPPTNSQEPPSTIPPPITVPAPSTPPLMPPEEKKNPQVVLYDRDVLGNDPTIGFINGEVGYDQFHTLSSRSSSDPATGVELQSPRSMNATTLMAIQRDPVRLQHARAAFKRANRDWDKEYADALAAGPQGSASAYTRTG